MPNSKNLQSVPERRNVGEVTFRRMLNTITSFQDKRGSTNIRKHVHVLIIMRPLCLRCLQATEKPRASCRFLRICFLPLTALPTPCSPYINHNLHGTQRSHGWRSFGRADCNLCMKERTEILKLKKKNPKGLINSINKFYCACRHKTKFHRYITANTLSTDEAINAEKSDNYLNSTYGDSEIMKEKDLLVCGVCRPALLNV